MTILLRVLSGVAVLILIVFAVAFLLPDRYRIERTIDIKAKPEPVFALIGDLRAWQKWTVWHDRDPQMKLSYSDRTTGVGAWSAWESKTEGNGRMTLTAVESPRRVAYTLVFPDFDMAMTGQLAIAPVADGVQVSWVGEGKLGLNPVNRWFGVFLDGMIGPDFEKGLAKLKSVSEAAR